jgi:hypothetical protein
MAGMIQVLVAVGVRSVVVVVGMMMIHGKLALKES